MRYTAYPHLERAGISFSLNTEQRRTEKSRHTTLALSLAYLVTETVWKGSDAGGKKDDMFIIDDHQSYIP